MQLKRCPSEYLSRRIFYDCSESFYCVYLRPSQYQFVINRYGAGSEYKREEKEEARRKRLGYTARNYNPDDQPWILKSGGKNGKK